MIAVQARTDRVAASPLGRASPLATLAVAVAWLVALATTTDPRPPVFVTNRLAPPNGRQTRSASAVFSGKSSASVLPRKTLSRATVTPCSTFRFASPDASREIRRKKSS
jgi:hypothetical protein